MAHYNSSSSSLSRNNDDDDDDNKNEHNGQQQLAEEADNKNNENKKPITQAVVLDDTDTSTHTNSYHENDKNNEDDVVEKDDSNDDEEKRRREEKKKQEEHHQRQPGQLRARRAPNNTSDLANTTAHKPPPTDSRPPPPPARVSAVTVSPPSSFSSSARPILESKRLWGTPGGQQQEAQDHVPPPLRFPSSRDATRASELEVVLERKRLWADGEQHQHHHQQQSQREEEEKTTTGTTTAGSVRVPGIVAQHPTRDIDAGFNGPEGESQQQQQQQQLGRQPTIDSSVFVSAPLTAVLVNEEEEKLRVQEAQKQGEELGRQQALSEVVTAVVQTVAQLPTDSEGSTTSISRRKSHIRRLKWLGLHVLVGAFIVIVVVVIVVFVVKDDKEDVRKPKPSSSPSITPNASLLENTTNIVCGLASPIIPDGPTIVDSLSEMIDDGEELYETCDGSGIQSPSYFGPSRWYTVQGDGRAFVATYCRRQDDDSSRLLILTGQCNERNYPKACTRSIQTIINATCTTYSWTTGISVLYYLLVVKSAGMLSSGEFQLTVSSNAVCNYAQEVYPISTNIAASTAHGQANDDVVHSCPSSTNNIDNASPGIWYFTKGTGNTLTFSTCLDSVFDTHMFVFHGKDCMSSLRCITDNDNGYQCGTGSSVSWLSIAGETYYIFIMGGGGSAEGTTTGSYTLSGMETPAFDVCEGAEELTLQQSKYIGSSKLATADTEMELYFDENFFNQTFSCGAYYHSPAVWYKFIGTGEYVNVNTCSNNTSSDENNTNITTDFDTGIDVLEGSSCDSFRCVAYGSDECDATSSSVTWFARDGIVYYVLVYGASEESGNFVLEFAPASLRT